MTALSGFLTRSGSALKSSTFPSTSSSVSLPVPAECLSDIADDSVSPHYLQAILSSFGYNSTSYLALEKDKKHYFHHLLPAVTAYAEFNKVAVTAGEPICPRSKLLEAVDEFIAFSERQSLKPLFFEVTEPVVPVLRERGFKFIKLGEEPFFDLDKFTLKGNKMANVRSSGNTAKNRGVTVREYEPIGADAPAINAQLEDIAHKWLQTRGISELSFILGTLSLEYPGDRRYFIAEQNNRVVAFVTYTPIYGREGVYLDLMRRSDDAPTGTMDLLLSESFLRLKSSGVKLATMGMSLLVNVTQSEIEQSQLIAKLMHQFSIHGDSVYHFKHLYDFQRKFNPNFWESKYLAYRHLGISELDAILRALLRHAPEFGGISLVGIESAYFLTR